jgi:FdhE protein
MARGAAGQSLLSTLALNHPEWRPLLVLIAETLRETERPQWARCVPALEHHGRGGRPLLDGAVFNVAPRLIDRLIRRILARAADAGTEVEPLARAMAAGRLAPRLLFEAAMSQDVDRLDELAKLHNDDRGLLRALAPLIAMPMLQACRTAWADRVPTDWAYGYCPVCGGRPALAESCGLDGTRYLRCAACGSGWEIEWLRCPFCGEEDHHKLGSLISADSLEPEMIDVCDGCRRYVKSITTLTAIRPEDVVLYDLATCVLDVAALEHDYRRPAATSHQVALRVVTETSRLREILGLRS